MKIVRLLTGICLIPLCIAASQTLAALIRSLQPDSLRTIPPAGWALAAGLALWFFLYLTLPKPVMSYVLAHELTHAFWGWLMGSRIFKIRMSERGGSVTMSKCNVMISLAPYFFPLYTVVVIVGYCALSIFWAVEPYYLYWLGLVGFTWGFHVTFTVTSLAQHQTDVSQYGRVFSYAVIYLLNILGMTLWVVAVSAATPEDLAGHLGHSLAAMCAWCWGMGRAISGKIAQ